MIDDITASQARDFLSRHRENAVAARALTHVAAEGSIQSFTASRDHFLLIYSRRMEHCASIGMPIADGDLLVPRLRASECDEVRLFTVDMGPDMAVFFTSPDLTTLIAAIGVPPVPEAQRQRDNWPLAAS